MREGFDKPIFLIGMDRTGCSGVSASKILLRLDPSCPIVDDEKWTEWDDLIGPGAAAGLLKEALNHPDLYTEVEPFPHDSAGRRIPCDGFEALSVQYTGLSDW